MSSRASDWSIPGISWHLHLRGFRLFPLDACFALGLTWLIRWLSLAIWGSPRIDVALYALYARAFWLDHPIGHAFPREYPPFALAPFSLTLVPPGWDPIATFTAWMAIVFFLGYLLTAHFAGRLAGLLYLFYLTIGVAAFIVARYDLVPAFMTLIALFALQRHRFALAGSALVLGGLFKLYPWFLLPLALVAAWQAAPGTLRRRLSHIARSAAAPLVLLVVGIILPWLLDRQAAFSAFTNAGQRPIQVEALWSLGIWIGTFFGHPATVAFSFGSHNWISPESDAIARWTTPLMVLGCLAIVVAFARGWLDLSRAFLATLCVVVLTNRVFSTQYLIWILPIAAAVAGFDLVWIAICCFTVWGTILYPFNDPFTPDQLNQFMLIMLGRDGLLAVALIRLFGRSSAPFARYIQQKTRLTEGTSVSITVPMGD